MGNINYEKISKIFQPPESLEISAEITVDRQDLIISGLSMGSLELQIEKKICDELARILYEKKLVEIQITDSPLYTHVTIRAKISVCEKSPKLKGFLNI